MIIFVLTLIFLIKASNFGLASNRSSAQNYLDDNFLTSTPYAGEAERLTTVKLNLTEGELNSLSTSAFMNQDSQNESLRQIVDEVVIPKKAWKYTVKKGETLSHIAIKFKVPVSSIISLNKLKANGLVQTDQVISLPGVTQVTGIKRTPSPVIAQAPIKAKLIQALSPIGNWVVPVTGERNVSLHSNNGLDVRTACGEPVYAADAGIVIEAADGWNGGYGNMIKIQGQVAVILYGHLTDRYVETGDYVKKGALIGTVGSTGKSTGCHLHFEVRGAKNFLQHVQ